MRVLVIEDNHRLAKLVADGLQRRGFSCDIATTLSDADSALGGAVYDATILDLGLPDGDGVAWLANRRQFRLMAPANIPTTRGALATRVPGLHAGADDSVVRPRTEEWPGGARG